MSNVCENTSSASSRDGGGNSSSSTMLIVETSESVTRSNQEPAMIYVLLGVIITV